MGRGGVLWTDYLSAGYFMAELYLHSHAELLNNQDSASAHPLISFVLCGRILENTGVQKTGSGHPEYTACGKRGGGWGFGHGLTRHTRATGARQPSLIICRWLWIRSGSGAGPAPGVSSLRCPCPDPRTPTPDPRPLGHHPLIPSVCLFACLLLVQPPGCILRL